MILNAEMLADLDAYVQSRVGEDNPLGRQRRKPTPEGFEPVSRSSVVNGILTAFLDRWKELQH
jgi:hypothetical protein